jgi:membrane fusion protein (multidrug efflux system)
MRRPAIVGFAATVAAALLARSAYTRPRPGPRDAAPAASSAAQASLPVQVALVARGALVQTIVAAGQAVADRQVTLHARVAGILETVDARAGARLATGAPLVAFDATDAELAVRQARAARARAYVHYRDLVALDDPADGPALRASRDSAARTRSGLAAAELDVERAELERQRTRVSAPFAGRVANVRVGAGQWVRLGDELLTLVAMRPIRVDVPVLEREVAQLAVGRSASITFAAFPGERFRGRVAAVSPLVERESRSVVVTLHVDDAGERVLPGMYARAEIAARRLDARLLVPRSAVLERDGRPMLFVLRARSAGPDAASRDGVAEWRYVTTGAENDALVEILPGRAGASVQAGEWVLVAGHETLVHGASVRATSSSSGR